MNRDYKCNSGRDVGSKNAKHDGGNWYNLRMKHVQKPSEAIFYRLHTGKIAQFCKMWKTMLKICDEGQSYS